MKRITLFSILIFLACPAVIFAQSDIVFGNGEVRLALLKPRFIDCKRPITETFISDMTDVFTLTKTFTVIDTMLVAYKQSEIRNLNPGYTFEDEARYVGKRVKADIVYGGAITEKDNGYVLELSTFIIKTGELDFHYKKSVPLRSALREGMQQFTASATVRYCYDKTNYMFFKSALIPGLGQFYAGHKIKGLLFFAGTAALIAKAAAMGSGDPYKPKSSLQAGSNGVNTVYYWDTRKISAAEYYAEMSRRTLAEASRRDAYRDKMQFGGLACLFYFLNLADTFRIMKKYNAQKLKGEFNIVSADGNSLSLNFHF